MRYYRIDITKPDGTPYPFKSLGGSPLTSLLPNGNTNPAALNIEFDLPVVKLDDPDNNTWLRVWGLGLQDIGSAFDLNGMNISIYGGMAKGLPLANPAQSGLLLKGQIFQAYGNWIGTDQTADMNIIAGGNVGSPAEPYNFVFSWNAGTPLAAAIAHTLSIVLPGVTQQIEISPKLVLNRDEVGWYESAQQFADFINGFSRSLLGGTYGGVSITTDGQTVRVYDGTIPAQTNAVKQIAFQDMIGQPTWIDAGLISVKLVLRADLHMGDAIKIPPSLATTQTANQALFNSSTSSPQNRSAFSGNFQIAQVHHYGNFRQADAASWNTTLQAYPTLVAS